MAENLNPPKYQPVSEGIDYGPFPLPEVGADPHRGDHLVMNAAFGHGDLYEMLRLKETLEARKAAHQIDEDVYERNTHRIDFQIQKLRAKYHAFAPPKTRMDEQDNML